jgi:hypothetical protein
MFTCSHTGDGSSAGRLVSTIVDVSFEGLTHVGRLLEQRERWRGACFQVESLQWWLQTPAWASALPTLPIHSGMSMTVSAQLLDREASSEMGDHTPIFWPYWDNLEVITGGTPASPAQLLWWQPALTTQNLVVAAHIMDAMWWAAHGCAVR